MHLAGFLWYTENMENDQMTAKKQILSVAKKLYYERGLNSVSFEDIARECNVTKPLISFHFGNKVKLANAIYAFYTDEHRRVFYSKAREIDKTYSYYEVMAAYILTTVKYYEEDAKAFRFYEDFFSGNFKDIAMFLEEEIGVFPQMKIGVDERHMKYIGTQYAARGLIYHYITGEIACSWETFAKYFVELSLGPFMNKVTPEQFLPGALELMDEIPIVFAPAFIWK